MSDLFSQDPTESSLFKQNQTEQVYTTPVEPDILFGQPTTQTGPVTAGDLFNLPDTQSHTQARQTAPNLHEATTELRPAFNSWSGGGQNTGGSGIVTEMAGSIQPVVAPSIYHAPSPYSLQSIESGQPSPQIYNGPIAGPLVPYSPGFRRRQHRFNKKFWLIGLLAVFLVGGVGLFGGGQLLGIGPFASPQKTIVGKWRYTDGSAKGDVIQFFPDGTVSDRNAFGLAGHYSWPDNHSLKIEAIGLALVADVHLSGDELTLSYNGITYQMERVKDSLATKTP